MAKVVHVARLPENATRQATLEQIAPLVPVKAVMLVATDVHTIATQGVRVREPASRQHRTPHIITAKIVVFDGYELHTLAQLPIEVNPVRVGTCYATFDVDRLIYANKIGIVRRIFAHGCN